MNATKLTILAFGCCEETATPGFNQTIPGKIMTLVG
jgi:hypothetical protein